MSDLGNNNEVIQLLGLESSLVPAASKKMKTQHKVCAYLWLMRVGCSVEEMYPSQIWKEMEFFGLVKGHNRSIHYPMKKMIEKGYATISRKDTDQDSYRRGTGKRIFYSLTDDGMIFGEAIFNANSRYFQRCMCLSRQGSLLA